MPLNTRFNVNLSTARGKSDFDLSPLLALYGATANSTLFHGRVDTDNYAFTLTSNPVPFLDAKVFYTYYNTSNKSDSHPHRRLFQSLIQCKHGIRGGHVQVLEVSSHS